MTLSLHDTSTRSTRDGPVRLQEAVDDAVDPFLLGGAGGLEVDRGEEVVEQESRVVVGQLHGVRSGALLVDAEPGHAALLDEPTGRLAIYYGGADTVTALAFAYLDEIIDFVKAESEL